jgi:uncharacterized membrane protein YgcG
MNKIHALVIAGLLAIAAALGLFASTRTAALGATSTVSDAQIQARSAQLDRAETQLRALSRQRPPALRASAVTVVRSSSGRSFEHADDDDHGEHEGNEGHGGHGRDHAEDD